MSLEPTFHCEHCKEKHDLEMRRKMLEIFLEKAEKAGNKDMARKLKGYKTEVNEQISKINLAHGDTETLA